MDHSQFSGVHILLDRLGDLIDFLPWSELAEFMNIEGLLSDVQSEFQNKAVGKLGMEIWAKAAILVQRSHQSCITMERENPNWRRRLGFRPLAKLILEIEEQVLACIDVLKVILIATTGRNPAEADVHAFHLQYKFSTQYLSLPINFVSDDAAIKAQSWVRGNSQGALEISLSILRSLPEVLDAIDPFGSVKRSANRKVMEQRHQFPMCSISNHQQKEEGLDRLRYLERKTDEITERLEKKAESHQTGNRP
ncbi:unnamed protein product [Clonostachys rosea]|uniref:Prion-inhibition and propagation HeLo domain-containing protein n=1 Tax=Bionectria ochroleuca TaxID=29856 RepID=A0ABY6TZC6_BIOOC|nr:unnamed protein product [Clonostachys rosea]